MLTKQVNCRHSLPGRCRALSKWGRGFVVYVKQLSFNNPDPFGMTVCILKAIRRTTGRTGRYARLRGELTVRCETWPDTLDQSLCGRAGRKEAKISAIAVHQVNKGGVIDGVTRLVVPFDFFVIHAIGASRRCNGKLIT